MSSRCLVWTSTQCPKKRNNIYFGKKDKKKMHNKMVEYNEDRLICDPPLFVILDGHGGKTIGIETEKMVRKKFKYPWVRQDETEESALIRIFSEIDRELYVKINKMSIKNYNKSSINHWKSGCTCTIALISGSELLCASIGDSQLFSFERKGGKYVVTFSSPLDEATDPIEIERIEKAGGRVYASRVGGELAMSRSFGDFELEKKNNPFSDKKKSYPDRMIVSAIPHVYRLPLQSVSGKEVWWILASDGLWDIVNINNITSIMDEINDDHTNISWDTKIDILLRLLPKTPGRNRDKWIKKKVNGDPYINSLPKLYDNENPPPTYPHDDRSTIIFVTNIQEE